MGTVVAKSDAATTASKDIEQQIRKQKIDENAVVRIILLGSGESGKSTLARQMKVLRLNGFDEIERRFFKQNIRFNVMQELSKLGELVAKELPMVYENNLRLFLNIDTWCEKYSMHWGDIDTSLSLNITELLQERSLMGMLREKQKDVMTHLSDSALYWFANFDRVTTDGYEPAADDIMRCRIPTVGVQELSFEMSGIDIRIIDVGGQRGQRKKWIHFFQGVQGMIFVTAISDYDRVLDEDGRTNRLQDSLTLFETLSTNPHFKNTSILIFFNKTDVFEAKIPLIPLSVCYRDYSGTNDYKTARKFVADKFLAVKPTDKQVYVHFTNATDTKNIERVFELSFGIIMKTNMQTAGIY